MRGKILIVDDEQMMCEMLEDDLKRHGFHPTWCLSAEKAFDALKEGSFDVLLTDLNMPNMNGIELCERIVATRPDIPVIVITAFGSMETAIAAIRAGAYDFVTKPIDTEFLVLALDRAIKHRSLQEKVKRLGEALNKSHRFDELIGESSPMGKLINRLERVADTETSILISGETGTGKELVAQALHRQSRRHQGPFVAVNCAALPHALLESELFGHKRGAFTDAQTERKGLFIQADGGTLFFDEIGDFPLDLQPKLLRSLEERRVRPIGGTSEVAFDVRIIAATNRDIETAVEEGRFREDLYYRINVIQIDLPPLRERGTDILLLAQHFVEQFALRSEKPISGISNAASEKLLNYTWPGNVRELRNIIERAVVLTRYEKISVDDLPEKIRNYNASNFLVGSSNPSELIPIQEVERRYILHVLKMVGGNKTLAARVLGLDRKTLYRKLQHYKVD
ncbi:MAG: sigma-54 dependent transcriptional regulator [Desulfobacterales bacterium]